MKKVIFMLFLVGIVTTVKAQTAEYFYSEGCNKLDGENYSDAILDFTKAIQKNKIFFEAYFMRAKCKNSIKDYYGSIADITKAIELQPNDPDSYFLRALVKGSIDDFVSAILDFNKAIEINPYKSKYYYFRGMAKTRKFKGTAMSSKDKESACSDFYKAKELGLKDPYLDSMIELFCR